MRTSPNCLKHYLLFLMLCSAAVLHAQQISLVKPLQGLVRSYESCNGDLYFTDDVRLWKTNGDSSNTFVLRQFRPFSTVHSLTCYNGKLYFIANDSTAGYELWTSDGTAQGTNVLKNISPGHAFPRTALPDGGSLLFVYNNLLYFTADDYYHGQELWQSDGTANGTQMTLDLNPTGTGVYNLSIVGNKLFFKGSDGDSIRLWTSDGTASGTKVVNTVVPKSLMKSTQNSYVYLHGQCKDSTSAFYQKWGLFVSNGTDTGTRMITDTLNYYNDFTFNHIELNGKAFFINRRSYKYQLYVTDGTKAGTVLLKDGLILNTLNANAYFTIYKNLVYFSASDKAIVKSGQLWVSDGTLAGTHPLTSINPFPDPKSLIEYDGDIFFRGRTNDRMELWSTDGTSQNTQVIPYINANHVHLYSYVYESPIFQHHKSLFFDAVYDTTIGIALYKYDYSVPPNPTNVTSAVLGKIAVYPNPVEETIYTSSKDVVQLTVYDMTGKMLLKEDSDHINVSSLAAGSYIIEITANGNKKMDKFIKMHSAPR